MTNKVICVEKVLKLIKDQTRSSTNEFSDGWNNALFMVMQNAESGNLTPSPAPAGVASLQGRVEALRIILGLCPESGLEDCVSWSTDITGENVASWDEEKLKKLLNIGGPIDHSPVAKIMEYAEELYWQAESRKSDLEFFPQRCRELESEVECLRAELRKRPTPTTNTREGM